MLKQMPHVFVSSRLKPVLLVALLGAGSVCHAGGAVILVPDQDRDVPIGSQIPEQRVKTTELRIREFKDRLEAQRAQQRVEALSKKTPSKPKPGGKG